MTIKRTEPSRSVTGEQELLVSGGSNVKSTAGKIMSVINQEGRVSLIAVGAGAVNQMVKSTIIARGYSAQSGVDLYVLPGFRDEMVGGEIKTAIIFYVRIR
jgi:stage V sporulation protein S